MLLIGAGAAGVAAAAAWVVVAGQQDAGPATASVKIMGRVADAEMLELGRHVYAENCASCHGAELEGQPNWKRRLESGRMPAPPHDETGHTWHHSDADLFRLTKEGVAAVVGGDYESDMPAFGGVLTDDEILAALAFIKSTWPERQRAYQAEITKKNSTGGGS
jgi:mono/diheme cytochrome c family protein